MQDENAKKPKKYCKLRDYYLKQIRSAEQELSSKKAHFWLPVWIGIVKTLLVLCSWPAYLTKSQQESFCEFAQRDERGLYLESYTQHSRYYRAAVASFLVTIGTIGLIITGSLFVGVVAFKPFQTEAGGGGEEQPSCTNPQIYLDDPAANVYCLTDDVFIMTAHWWGTGFCSELHSIYFTYMLPDNQYVDMDTSTTALTVTGDNPYTGVAENTPTDEYINCRTTGAYKLRPRTEIPRYNQSNYTVYVNAPTAPSNLQQSTTTTSTIRLFWNDNSTNEERFRIQRQANISPTTTCSLLTNLATTNTDVNLYNNTALTTNIGYCYAVRAENGNGNTDYAIAVKMYTLPAAPNLSASRSTSTWYNASGFEFTNAANWNEGGVRYYRYVWDTYATHTWADSETLWSEAEDDCPPFDGGNGSCGTTSNSLSKTASSDSNNWYLHVRSYNYGGANNGSQDYGPFYFDGTAPGTVSSVTDGSVENDVDYTNVTSEFNGFWGSATDNLSGLQKYQYALGTTSGGTEIISWTDNSTTTSISLNDLSLVNGQTYYLSVRAVDNAGNNSNVVTSDGLIIDTVSATPAAVSATSGLTSATITWTTNELTTTQLEWGPTEAYGNLTTEDEELSTTHAVSLSGLNENTTYYFRVRGKDRAENETLGEAEFFTTTEVEPTIITSTASEVLSTTSVRISWTTNHAATSRVRYGLTTAYGLEVSDNALVTGHSLTLTGLTAGATYHYEVLSVGNTSVNDADATFTTLANTAISNIQAETIDSNTTEITWTTNHIATSEVQYGETTNYGQEVSESGLVTSHSLALTQLEADTTYHFRVVSVGNSTAASADQTFTTPAEEPEPEPEPKPEPEPSTKLPSPTIVSPKTGETTIKVKPVITGLAKSGNSILVYIDGRYNGKTRTTKHSSDTGSFAYKPFLNLTTGWHTVKVRAEDDSGKRSAATKEVRFKIELPYVTPTIIEPVVYNGIEPKVIVKGVARNNSKIQVFLDGEMIDEFEVQNQASGTAHFVYEISTNSSLATGEHTVTLIALDEQGKPSHETKAVTFTKTTRPANT